MKVFTLIHNKSDMKKYKVTIYLDAFEVTVSANNKAEAKRKAIEKLQEKKITSNS